MHRLSFSGLIFFLFVHFIQFNFYGIALFHFHFFRFDHFIIEYCIAIITF